MYRIYEVRLGAKYVSLPVWASNETEAFGRLVSLIADGYTVDEITNLAITDSLTKENA